MVKPSNRQKKILLIVGITGAVYASFKYLLPLVIPFLIAYLIALALRPSAIWLRKKCQVTVKGRRLALPLGVIGGLELILIVGVAGLGLYFGMVRLCEEARLLTEQLPVWVESVDVWLTSRCHWMEQTFRLRPGCLVVLARDMLKGLANSLKDTTMPFLFINSVTMFKHFIKVIVIGVILFISVMLCLQEMDRIRENRAKSVFKREYALLGKRLTLVGRAYVKTQGSILLLTVSICIAGLFLMGNPYYILLGFGIGILDALPVFGTGTVLLPWALVSAVQGSWGRMAVLLAIYLICYFLRQFMEAKMMGDRVGLSPLETLVSMYVGLKLFGLMGVVLGPIGVLIVIDLVDAYSGD